MKYIRKGILLVLMVLGFQPIYAMTIEELCEAVIISGPNIVRKKKSFEVIELVASQDIVQRKLDDTAYPAPVVQEMEYRCKGEGHSYNVASIMQGYFPQYNVWKSVLNAPDSQPLRINITTSIIKNGGVFWQTDSIWRLDGLEKQPASNSGYIPGPLTIRTKLVTYPSIIFSNTYITPQQTPADITSYFVLVFAYKGRDSGGVFVGRNDFVFNYSLLPLDRYCNASTFDIKHDKVVRFDDMTDKTQNAGKRFMFEIAKKPGMGCDRAVTPSVTFLPYGALNVTNTDLKMGNGFNLSLVNNETHEKIVYGQKVSMGTFPKGATRGSLELDLTALLVRDSSEKLEVGPFSATIMYLVEYR